MELKLSPATKVKEIKKQFSGFFPYLRLEFFKQRHVQGEGSFFSQKIDDIQTLNGSFTNFKEGVFVFDSSTSVSELEQRLQLEHGLSVQVFRKSGNIWLETVQTDNLSLTKQNEMGEHMSSPLRFNTYMLFL